MGKPEQWPRIKEIVGAALERDPVARGVFLDQACSQDTELRAEVDSLLAAYADADELSENPWAATTVADLAGEQKTIGLYRLIQTLGVGGMGQVWLAEQTEPVRRRVALKLIRAGMYDSALVQRFQSERQLLAIMEHPAIAKVFDAGTTSEGQPYFAMEYVDGPPITDYCDRKKLGIRERLKLFMQVCEGVQHAHQKAIIHRDLKPSNILVAEVDGKPTPRIIDFGLAKAAVPHAFGETLFTHVGGFLGTPGYMSPEQADANVHDIDTRTDVYSLGVVLYELLTGYLPFDTTQWKKQRLDEVLRQLRETDPERPSTRVSANRETSTARAEARGTVTGQLVSALRGDLDWITLKALEKERERRYVTPSALAADVERYLQDRPVEARPASAAYRLRKYVRRNRVGVAVAAGLAVVLIGFAVMQTIELRRITRERDRADRVTEFMTSMFKVSDPSESRGNSITAREILDKSSKEIDTGLANDPELKAQMLHVMGKVYSSLGLYSTSENLSREALDIRRRVLGLENRDTLASQSQLADALAREGRYSEAEKMGRELIEVSTRVLGPTDRTTLRAQSDLAMNLGMNGRFVEAKALCRRTFESQQKALGKEDLDTLETARRLAIVEEKQGRLAEAERIYREVLDVLRHALGSEHPLTLKASDDLGILLVEENRFDEAEPVLQQTLAIQSRVLGRDHPDTLMTMGNLATVLENQLRYTESEQLQREVLARYRRVLGNDHPSTALALFNIGDVLYWEHRYTEAIPFLREAVDIQRRVLGPGHPDTVDSVYDLARGLALTQKNEEAISLLRDAVDRGVGAETAADLKNGTDWKSLRGEARFEALVVKAQEHVAASLPKTN